MRIGYICALLVSAAVVSSAAEGPSFEKSVQPFLAKNCYTCHNAKLQSGKLDLESYKTALSVTQDRERWEEILRKLSSGEMPPKGLPRPPETETKLVAGWIEKEFDRADRLGHRLLEEQDARVSLLDRLIQHARASAEFSVYYGRGRDGYDVRGRVAHESLFNASNGSYRGPNSQQGYSPFTTWTRGLAWAMLGFAEQLEFLDTVDDDSVTSHGGRAAVEQWMLDAACATSDYYMEIAASDGIPYWDSGAPNLSSLGDWSHRPADPFNEFEPVDSSAAAIAAQGLLRLGRYLAQRRDDGRRYAQAGLLILDTLFDPSGPYLSVSDRHQGLLLHSVYHRPAGWDHVPAGARTPRGESSQWGDYHAREAALYVQRLACNGPYLAFFGGDRVQAAA